MILCYYVILCDIESMIKIGLPRDPKRARSSASLAHSPAGARARETARARQ